MKMETKSGLMIITVSIIVSSVLGLETPAMANKANLTDSNSFVAAAASSKYVSGSNAFGFTDLPSKHWAYSSIKSAFENKLVTGYSDGTFRPDKSVTVAEFAQLLMRATGTEFGKDFSKWYLPAIDGAKKAGYITVNDYKDGNYNKVITRAEMAKMAALALGKKGSSSNEFLLEGVKLGLIGSNGSKGLDAKGSTTRAQAVVIIQRVQMIKDGKTLTVDEKALAEAGDLVAAKKDAWGQLMRTSNLPSNHQDYPYILADFPNEFYELPYKIQGPSPSITKPNKMMKEDQITKATYAKVKKMVEDWMDLTLNVDYRTIDYTWADKYFKLNDGGQYTTAKKEAFIKELRSYVDWVKTNKIVTKGTSKAEISTIAYYDSKYQIKVLYTYKVVEGKVIHGNKATNSIFNNQLREHKELTSGYKLGTEIQAVSVVKFSKKSSADWDDWDNMIMQSSADLSFNTKVIK